MKFIISKMGELLKPLPAAVAGAIVIICIIILAVHRQAPPGAGDESAANVTTVAVAKATRQDLFNEVTIPAEFRPYVEAILHAKVAGYVSQMNVDFGDKVKAGQLLATLEVPELQAELVNAQAAEEKAEADYTNSHLIYTRLEAVDQQHPNLVAQQDLDTAEANDSTAYAAIAEAKANVNKYQTLFDYTKITAPFDGVITHRYVDPGTLIQTGTASDTQSLPIVTVSDNYRLRLDFPVSVDYVKDIKEGDPVKVRVDSDNNKTFTGTITRFTHDVDEATRTMTVEIEVPNPDLELIPGMYATVVLTVEKHANALAVPIQAMGGENNSTVLVVNQNNEIEERAVKVGIETSDQCEITAGLQDGDVVVIGSRSRLRTGQKVDPKLEDLSFREGN